MMLQAVSHLTIQRPAFSADYPKDSPFTRLQVLVLQLRKGENSALLSVFMSHLDMLGPDAVQRQARAGELDNLLINRARWDLAPAERDKCDHVVGTGVQVLYKDRWLVNDRPGLAEAPEMVSHRRR